MVNSRLAHSLATAQRTSSATHERRLECQLKRCRRRFDIFRVRARKLEHHYQVLGKTFTWFYRVVVSFTGFFLCRRSCSIHHRFSQKKRDSIIIVPDW